MGILKKIIEKKYLALVPTDESKDALKNMKNYGAKSKILSDQYLITKKYMKIKFNLIAIYL